MQIAILGPLEAHDADGRPVEVAGTRLRTLLCRLALDPGRPVGVSVLVDAVWGDQPPADESNALQTLVSRLRRALGGAATIGQSPAGYRLAVEPEDVDAFRVQQLAARGAAALRAGRAEDAAHTLRSAEALWRGPALADAGDWAAADADRLHDLRLTVFVDRADADLALGRASEVLPELEAWAAAYPLHERLAGQLVRALAAAGRQADALTAYERVRSTLADDLGVDPSAELQAIHLAVLRGEIAEHHATPGPRSGARQTNLKAQLTSFVGREDEVSRIAKSLEENRLVTLVGPGGVGKTRLAGEAATTIVDEMPDGIWLVELAPVTDAADLPQTVLGSLGIREAHLLDRRSQLSARDATSRLLETLADKRTVLILDNCEHLIEASARLADHLLARCPQLRILATSREPLGIIGEALLVAPPLGQPTPGAGAEESLEFPAVRLFVDRAAASAPDLVVDDATIGTVIEIVRRLDGLPLAIELAAARLRSMPLAEIAARLSDRFRLLTGGSRTAMPRHRTLRAVVEWSWGLLTQPERTLVERLAVFAAGATTESAVAVCADGAASGAGDVAPEDVADLLASLVEKSLLQPVDGGARVRMLETIREYGIERLAERGELTEARRRQADYCARLLTEAQPHLISASQLPWFELLTAERDNILAAIRFRADIGDADGALEIGVAIAGFAMLLGNHSEVPLLVGDALTVPGGTDRELRALGDALYTMNSIMGSNDPANDATETAMKRMQQIGDSLRDIDLDRHPLVALLRVATAFFGGDTELADRFADEAMESGNAWTAASVLMFRANLAENRGDVDAMRADTAAALTEFRRLGERWGTASTLRGMALLHTLDGDLDAAETAYAEALDLMTQMNSRDDEGFMRVRLADLRLRRGDVAGARAQMALARAAAETTGSVVEAVFTDSMTAFVEREAGNDEVARRLGAKVMERADTIPAGHPIQGHLRALTLIMATSFARLDGELDLARRYAVDAYAASIGTTDMPIVASIAVAIAALLVEEGQPERAARTLGAAAVLRGADDPTAIDIARVTGELTDMLGAEAFAAAYERGRVLDQDAALAFVDPTREEPAPDQVRRR